MSDTLLSILKTFAADRKPPAEPVDPHAVVPFLAGVARTVPDPLSEDQRRTLFHLCRKTDIAHKVFLRYEAGWKKPVDRTPLPAEAWPPLVAALLLAAAGPAEGEEARGEAFKLINAAWNALDLAREAGADPAALKALVAEAEGLLAKGTAP